MNKCEFLGILVIFSLELTEIESKAVTLSDYYAEYEAENFEKFLPQSLRDCEIKWNITIHPSAKLPDNQKPHTMESCLYYYIKDRARNRPHHLLPGHLYEEPLTNADDTLQVTIRNVSIKQLSDVYTDLSSVYIDGELFFEWMDLRFQWDAKQWNQNFLVIESKYDVWAPKLDAINAAGKATEYGDVYDQTVIAYPNGKMVSKARLTLPVECSSDYSRFPKDTHRCKSHLAEDLDFDVNLRFHTLTSIGIVEQKKTSKIWNIMVFTVEVHADTKRHPITEWVELEFVISRQSSALKMELSMPVIVCCVVVMLSPLFGDIKTQCMVKMFAILLQLLAMHFLSARIPKETFAGHTPRLYRFYEFSITFSIASLAATVLLMAFGRFERRLPPPHNLFLMSSVVNRYLCCAEGRAEETQEQRAERYRAHELNVVPAIEGGNHPTPSTFADYHSDWMTIFTAINNTISVWSTLIYLGGVLFLLHF